jgi:2-polyprenyl-3-methyl-5-hydroxy-6-metoxy-1,4-benzoquinol methylase
MNDLFKEKSVDYDANERIQKRAKALGKSITDNVKLNQTMHVLDFGAGTGLLCSPVAPHVGKITAIDISESMLNKLLLKPELKDKVQIVCKDLTSHPTGEHYDLIMSAMALHHVEDTDLLIHTFSNHLKPGGQIALVDLDSEDGTFHAPGTEGIFHHGFDRQALSKIFEKHGFKDIHFVTAHEEVKENRTYPLFLATATK